MCLCHIAWNEITNCWSHTKIIGKSESIIIDPGITQAEEFLNEENQRLESLGLITLQNQMSISDLLNPERENKYEILSTAEIFDQKDSFTQEEDELHCGEASIPILCLSKVQNSFNCIMNYIPSCSSRDTDQLSENLEAFNCFLDSQAPNHCKKKSLLDHLAHN
ncbi:hypothetical protein O181_032313 [Austropuccinia psidii MF-1]|uniref:Uncharacterized protein n=1 Tax=Austropuccinia psidii MF-1 TaxID=1389203 RepID=A0A9Q3D1C7_9BASI|nr:hypothetical protein [Austropuccinia psidii MF-1]